MRALHGFGILRYGTGSSGIYPSLTSKLIPINETIPEVLPPHTNLSTQPLNTVDGMGWDEKIQAYS